MKLLAILVLGAALAYWVFLRPAPPASSGSASSGNPVDSGTAVTQPRTARPSGSNGARNVEHPKSDNAGSFIKRPIDRAKKAIDANQKRLEDEF